MIQVVVLTRICLHHFWDIKNIEALPIISVLSKYRQHYHLALYVNPTTYFRKLQRKWMKTASPKTHLSSGDKLPCDVFAVTQILLSCNTTNLPTRCFNPRFHIESSRFWHDKRSSGRKIVVSFSFNSLSTNANQQRSLPRTLRLHIKNFHEPVGNFLSYRSQSFFY